MHINAKVMSTNNNNYICHMRAVYRTCLTMQSYRVYVISLVNNSLGGHTYTNMHADFLDKSSFKKPGLHLPMPNLINKIS